MLKFMIPLSSSGTLDGTNRGYAPNMAGIAPAPTVTHKPVEVRPATVQHRDQKAGDHLLAETQPPVDFRGGVDKKFSYSHDRQGL